MALETPTGERSANAQWVEDQRDGAGKRIGRRGELTVIAKVVNGGAALFRDRLPKAQAEAAYWQARVGATHEVRAFLFDDDRRLALMISYDGDLQTYMADLLAQAGPWLDDFFVGVWKGYQGADDPRSAQFMIDCAVSADLFYVAHPEVTVRETTRMKRLSSAVSDVLDAAG